MTSESRPWFEQGWFKALVLVVALPALGYGAYQYSQREPTGDLPISPEGPDPGGIPPATAGGGAPGAPTLAGGGGGGGGSNAKFAIGKTAPDIEGEDIDGVKFKLSDYRGKVVVLDFWGDW